MTPALRTAMVLAAGRGLRMRPLTDNKPKPLIEVAGKALIDHALDWLAASGIVEAVVNGHYRAHMLKAHLAARRRPKVHFIYEEQALETGGGVKNALPLLGGSPFVSINSDAICLDGAQPALARLAAGWDDTAMDALLLLHPLEKAIGYDGAGDFFLETDGRLRRRGEKKSAPFVFTGVQILHPRLFKDASGGAFSLNVLYDRARICGLAHDGQWLHVGDPAGLAAAETFLRSI